MAKPFIFDYERYPDWLSELIEKGSVIEGEEPPDQWEDAYMDPVLYCWQPNGEIITVYSGHEIQLAQYKDQDGSVVKYAELVD